MHHELINKNENLTNFYSVDEMIHSIETWLVSGKLDPTILSENFQFHSPFWQNATKNEFIATFEDPKAYIDTALSKITHFDPIIPLKSLDGNHFAIILQYHTQNGNHVYETVLGTLEKGLLLELRSIYDLNETKKSLEIN